MRLRLSSVVLASLFAAAAAGCTAASDPAEGADGEQHFSSNQATELTFEFDGELLADFVFGGGKQAVQDQMLYTIGHLNHDRAVGRLDKLELTNVTTTREGQKTRVKYHAKLPVAWGSKTNLPTTYDFRVPADVSSAALESFTEKYKHDCVDFGAHDVDSGSMWYYYRPLTSGCNIADADVVAFKANVTRSAANTAGKYPEYHKVWEDNQLNVVSIFGKYEDGKTEPSDAGISAYNSFVRAIRGELSRFALTTEPAEVPDSPGVSAPDITFHATLPGGKQVNVTALLVDNISQTGPEFDRRYEALSANADMIAYNGHAGLGQNVRALARKGRWVAGKYVIVFMNGCDTFAYVDGSLAETRARINADDPTGTKYMEFVTNAMPAFFSSMPNASMSLIRGLMKHEAPLTYDKIFESVDRSQIVLVTGEEDNTFTPGEPPPPPPGQWAGMDERGSVTRGQEARFKTPSLPEGTYKFTIEGDGDADLYVRRGTAPTTRLYDCRPFEDGSREECTVSLASPGEIHVMVRGFASQASTFRLVGAKQ
jgi:hypothetical protein